MEDVKKFFSEERQYESKCELKHFILESSNCKDIADGFVSHSYDASIGSMVITTNVATMPTDLDANSIVYKTYINEKEALDDDISVSNGILTVTVPNVDSVYSDGTTGYGSSPYSIKIITSLADKTTGCIFDYTVPKLSKDRLTLEKVGDVYSVVYTPVDGEVFNINSGTYRWRINGKIVNNTGTSIVLNNKSLINYTDDKKAVCSVELVGANVLLKTESINIARNEYLIQTVYSPVINGNDFYLNFSTTHNTDNVKVDYYIDNVLLPETHALWNSVKGKELTTVITPNLMAVSNPFDASNLDTFTAYFRQKIEDSVNFNFNSNPMLNDVSGSKVFNNTFTARQFILNKNENGDYGDFEGKTLEIFKTVDENPAIMKIIDGTWNENKRPGLIYQNIADNGDIEDYVITDEFASKRVTHNSIVRKEDIYVNDEPTTFYLSVADLSVDFTGDLNQLKDDASIGITPLSNGSDSNIEFKAADNEEIIVVDFITGFVRGNAPIGSGISIDFYTEENFRTSSFGLVKIGVGEYLIREDNGSVSHKFQMSYNKSFHIRASSQKSLKYMRINFKNCKEESTGLRNMVITTRKV